MIKAIFLDVDGTLISFKTHRVPASALDALREAHARGVQLFRERTHGSLLIITHSTRILEALTVDASHIMENGVIVRNGGAELVDEINENGFSALDSENAD